MNKAEKIWSNDAKKMKNYLLQELQETGLQWKSLMNRHLEDYEAGKVLDVGCGTGFSSLLLAYSGHEVVAIDNNEAMIVEAEKTAEELGMSDKITFLLKDAEANEFLEGSFDAVVSKHAFWLFDNPEKVYANWYKILKQGGCVLNIDANWLLPFWGEDEKKRFMEDEETLVKRYGEFKDYYHDEDMMSALKEKPLSYVKRPEWDLDVCEKIGFRDIVVENISQEKYWNAFMAIRYRSMPTFLVKAKK